MRLQRLDWLYRKMLRSGKSQPGVWDARTLISDLKLLVTSRGHRCCAFVMIGLPSCMQSARAHRVSSRNQLSISSANSPQSWSRCQQITVIGIEKNGGIFAIRVNHTQRQDGDASPARVQRRSTTQVLAKRFSESDAGGRKCRGVCHEAESKKKFVHSHSTKMSWVEISGIRSWNLREMT